MKEHFFKLAVLFVVALGNFWIWRIFSFNIYIAFFEILATFSLFFLLRTSLLKGKLLNVGILLTINLLILAFIYSDFNFKLESQKPAEILKSHGEELYYSQELGRVFLNKFSLYYYYNWNLYLYKLQRNFFYLADFNQYFFATHPRERGVYEFEKYTFLELPFFVIGIFWLILKNRKLIFLYLLITLILNTFIDPAFRLGPIFMFPLLSCLIAVGIIQTAYFIKENGKFL